jgi:hypothetical protein
MLLLVLLLLVSLRGDASATLTYPTRADAVAAATAYLSADSAVRLSLSKGAGGRAALSLPAMDALLVDRLHLIQPAGLSVPWVDLRAVHLPAVNATAPAVPLVTYNGSAPPGTPPDASALALTTAAAWTSASMPQEMVEVKYGVLVYASLLSDDAACPDVNELPTTDPRTGKVECGCAEGRPCAYVAGAALVTSVVGTDSLPGTAAIVNFVATGAIVLVSVLVVAVVLRQRRTSAAGVI